eukprot:1161410-Pelagomonas_calceolata.AAC.11
MLIAASSLKAHVSSLAIVTASQDLEHDVAVAIRLNRAGGAKVGPGKGMKMGFRLGLQLIILADQALARKGKLKSTGRRQTYLVLKPRDLGSTKSTQQPLKNQPYKSTL